MRRARTFVVMAGCAFIAACGGEHVRPAIERVAHVRALTDGTYEVQLRYSITSSGGPCLNRNVLRMSTSYDTNWLYVKALEGTIVADQVVLTSDAGKMEWPYAVTNLQGRVSFTNTTMTVELQCPRYPDGEHLAGFTPYELNGTYQIHLSSQPNRQGGANGRQPFSSEAAQTSAAAACRRSP